MNILLWVLQVLLAVHTAIGAIWKFSNPEANVPSLSAIPHGVWLSLSVIELLCALGLLLPAIKKTLGKLVPISAGIIAAEMLIFCGIHLASGDSNSGPMIYWLVVAVICAFIAYGRTKLKPL
jgi:xanthine/uracil/vitamin C permease (AzgA family)